MQHGRLHMESIYSKPRVFLSHSKKNSEFIEKLADDFRKCQIEPWIDTVEIRHGKSWQDSIFQYGLPTCDAVIVYFTELSIQSPVVKKEMDVALLQNLKDNNVAFLPYVNNEELRISLRPDIQALQVPEWNNENYHLLLPRVVAEIWRSYLERTVLLAVKDERLKRAQLELEIEKRKKQDDDVFSSSEKIEFEYIYRNLNRLVDININYGKSPELGYLDNRGTFEVVFENVHKIDFNLNELFVNLISVDKTEYVFTHVKRWVSNEIEKLFEFNSNLIEEIKVKIKDNEGLMFDYRICGVPDMLDDLRLFGLIETKSIEVDADRWDDKVSFRFLYTEKFFRYRYWLAYHNNLPNEIKFSVVNLYN